MSDADDVPLPGMPEPDPSLIGDVTGRRRTERERVELFLGYGMHPVARVPLHPDAPRDASRTDRYPRDFTCGTCVFREVLAWQAGIYPKCLYPAGDPVYQPTAPDQWVAPRVTHSATSDVRRWWPACRDYQRREPTP